MGVSQLVLGRLKASRHAEVREHSKQGKHFSPPSLYGYWSGNWLVWFVKVRGERKPSEVSCCLNELRLATLNLAFVWWSTLKVRLASWKKMTTTAWDSRGKASVSVCTDQRQFWFGGSNLCFDGLYSGIPGVWSPDFLQRIVRPDVGIRGTGRGWRMSV
jgi:hypothetical protein